MAKINAKPWQIRLLIIIIGIMIIAPVLNFYATYSTIDWIFFDKHRFNHVNWWYDIWMGPYTPKYLNTLIVGYYMFLSICLLFNVVMFIALLLMKPWARVGCMLSLIVSILWEAVILWMGNWVYIVEESVCQYVDGSWQVPLLKAQWQIEIPFLIIAIPTIVLLIYLLMRPTVVQAFLNNS